MTKAVETTRKAYLLDESVAGGAKIPFYLKPWKHQIEGLKFHRNRTSVANLSDMGTGKTAETINALREKYYQYGRVLKSLILCPTAVTSGWAKEFRAHASPAVNERTYLLIGSGKYRLEVIEKAIEKHGPNVIFITNYQTLTMAKVFNLLEGWGPEAIVADESQRLKNHRAKTTEKAWRLADGAGIKIILSGSAILQNPLDLFAQWRFLDCGQTFGRNYFAFRSRFFEDKNAGMLSNPDVKDKHFPRWEVINDDVYRQLNELIYKSAYRVMKSECLDLPPFVRVTRETSLGKEQAKAYAEMKKDFITYIESDACVAELALTKALRLQQLLSGFAKLDESGDVHRFPSIPRIDTLKEILEEIAPSYKVVIWATFKEEYEMIAEAVENLGISHRKLVGGMSQKQRDKSLEDFKNFPQVRVMIANPGSAGVGVDGLQVANHAIYYSRSYNLEHDLQSNDRIYRGGSEIHDKVTRIDIVAPNTLDDLVLEALKKKLNEAEAVLSWKSKAHLI